MDANCQIQLPSAQLPVSVTSWSSCPAVLLTGFISQLSLFPQSSEINSLLS